MRARLEYQAGHAIVWRDAIVQYFLKLSGIPDEHGRAGKLPGRLEAEDAELSGYKVIDVQPWEDASRGRRFRVAGADNRCSAEWTWSGQPGRFDIAVQYFDLEGGAAKFSLSVDGKSVAAWTAERSFSFAPAQRRQLDALHGARRRTEAGRRDPVDGTPDGADPAALDYVEVTGSEPTLLE